MPTGHVASLKSLPFELASQIAQGPGFAFGDPCGRFSFARRDSDGVVYRSDTLPLEYRVSMEQHAHAFAIAASVRNTSTQPITGIDSVEPLRLVFDVPELQWRHIYAGGGFTDSHYPPGPFRTGEWSHARERLRLQSHHRGYSSNVHLPILISLSSTDPDADGFFCALEWSGSWHITFEAENARQCRLVAGVPVHSMTLDAGEELALPRAHIGFFTGGADAGTNAVRRYLYEQICPCYAGERVVPRVSYDHWFGIGNDLNDTVLRRQADRAAELGVEMFVIDAGWFGDFPDGVGNWDRVDAGKFPDGLEPIGDYVRSKGMQLGLWFEPERAGPDSTLFRRHPGWFVRHDYGPDSPIQGYHLNLAIEEAQDCLIEMIGGTIERLQLKWSRWDYNIDPGVLWRERDPSHRLQFDYYRGLYRVLDTLMERHSDWMVEMCAGGGRRIDLGTMRRAHTFWMSDHTERASLCRCMQARANRFLPGHLLNSSVAVGASGADETFTATSVLSRMVGKLAFDGRIADLTVEQTELMALWVAQYKAIRHLVVRDFYQLLPQPQTVEDWDAVQFTSYDRSDVVVFVFAGNAAATRRIRLKALESGQAYEAVRMPDGTPLTSGGGELCSRGLEVSLGREEGALYRVSRVTVSTR